MQRRQFTSALTATAAAATLPVVPAVRAQGLPVEGQQYKRLEPAVAVQVEGGRIDVVEFFAYACPHCAEFEPVLEPWVAKLPPDVRFRRVPAPFMFNAENFQRLYYTLEALNLVDKLQQKVFDTVHVEKNRLLRREDIAAFATKHGQDAAKFMGVFDSFGVQGKARQAAQVVRQFNVSAIPTLAVQGRWTTSPADAKGLVQATQVLDFLIRQVRGR